MGVWEKLGSESWLDKCLKGKLMINIDSVSPLGLQLKVLSGSWCPSTDSSSSHCLTSLAWPVTTSPGRSSHQSVSLLFGRKLGPHTNQHSSLMMLKDTPGGPRNAS